MKVTKLLFSALILFTSSSSIFAYVTFDGDQKLGNTPIGQGATITWSFHSGNDAIETSITQTTITTGLGEHLDTFMPAGYEAEIQRAFDSWAQVADITFTQVADETSHLLNNGAAQIRISGHSLDGTNGTLAHASTPALTA